MCTYLVPNLFTPHVADTMELYENGPLMLVVRHYLTRGELDEKKEKLALERVKPGLSFGHNSYWDFELYWSETKGECPQHDVR